MGSIHKHTHIEMSPSQPSVDEASSPLLGLPPELRNAIYTFAALDEQPYHYNPRLYAAKDPDRQILSHCPFILLNKQIYGEYRGVLSKTAFLTNSKIVLPVKDFNFRATMRFLQTYFKPEELQALCANKRLIIELTISTTLRNVAPEALTKWLVFCDRNNISAGYACDSWTCLHREFERNEMWCVRGLGPEDRESWKIHEALADLRSFRHERIGEWPSGGWNGCMVGMADAVLMPRYTFRGRAGM